MEIENKSLGLSLLVCNYNAPIEAILLTMISAIKQKGIDFEIIYCDDASKNNHQKEIEEFFKKHGFNNYQWSCKSSNVGTVKNILLGLKLAKYKYAKTIGAGDLFYDENTFAKAIKNLETNQAVFLATNIVYFFEDQKMHVYNKANPAYTKCYFSKSYNQQMIKKNLLVSEDLIAGSGLFAKTSSLFNLLSRFEGKIKYTEDVTLIYAAFSNAKFAYEKDYCVFYEFGTGISAQNSSFMKTILEEDDSVRNEVISLKHSKEDQKIANTRLKIDRAKGIKKKLLRLIHSPFKLKVYFIRKKLHKAKPSFDFYYKCKEEINA